MRRDSDKWLADILLHGEACRRFLEGKSADDYLEDELLRSAVERKLYIVGEAVVQMRMLDPELVSDLVDVLQIVGFRNFLAHGYFAVDDRRVLAIANDDLPALIEWAKKKLSGAFESGEDNV